MDSHVYRKAANRLPALADLAVLRFNTRGTSSDRGTSRARSTEARASGSTWPRRWSTPSSTTCPGCGWSAGRSAPSWRSSGAATRWWRAPSCSLRRCTGRPTPTWTPGRRSAGRWSRWCRSSTTTCARRRRGARFARVPQAEVVGVDGAKHLWVGEPYVRIVLERDRAPRRSRRLPAADRDLIRVAAGAPVFIESCSVTSEETPWARSTLDGQEGSGHRGVEGDRAGHRARLRRGGRRRRAGVPLGRGARRGRQGGRGAAAGRPWSSPPTSPTARPRARPWPRRSNGSATSTSWSTTPAARTSSSSSRICGWPAGTRSCGSTSTRPWRSATPWRRTCWSAAAGR